MKKLFFAVFSVALILSSCGGSGKGAENVKSENDADQIITYTNAVIDYLNASNSWIRTNETSIQRLIEAGKAGKKPSGIVIFGPSPHFTSGSKDITKPASVMSEDEKKFFSEKVTLYKTTFDALYDDCKTLHAYIKNEDYKDDNGEKGKELAAKIERNYTLTRTEISPIYDKIEVVTEVAETIILEKNPLKEPILSMKKDLKGFDNLYELFAAYDEKTATPAQVDEAYQALAAQIEKNKGSFGDILKGQNKASSYNRFYESADKYLASFRKALRDVKENKTLKERDFKSFSSNHNSLISSYNSFVN